MCQTCNMMSNMNHFHFHYPQSLFLNTNEENGKYFFHDIKAHYQKVTGLAHFKKGKNTQKMAKTESS